jgi:hypothetical protein
MTTTPTVPPYANDTPAELADAARGLANNVRTMAQSWKDYLPPEMQAGGLFVAGMEIGDANFGPGQGAAMLCQSLVELIHHNPGIVAAMVPQLAELNRLVLLQQSKMMAHSPVENEKPNAQAIEDLRVQLYCIRENSIEIIDKTGGNKEAGYLVAEILDDLEEAHRIVNVLEGRKPKRKIKSKLN